MVWANFVVLCGGFNCCDTARGPSVISVLALGSRFELFSDSNLGSGSVFYMDLDLGSLLDMGFCSRFSLGLGSRLLDPAHEGSSANS